MTGVYFYFHPFRTVTEFLLFKPGREMLALPFVVMSQQDGTPVPKSVPPQAHQTSAVVDMWQRPEKATGLPV